VSLGRGGGDRTHAPSFRSNFNPIQEVGSTACFHVSDTRCGTYVIEPACMQSRWSRWVTVGRGDSTFFQLTSPKE